MVESTFGDSHPGSAHLDQFVRQAVQAVNEHGGKAARYFATDLCDGIAQGHDGINYSLAHREAIVDLVEAQANASGFDGGIFIASCDKAVPAMLMSIGRLKEMSAIVVTGGVMEAHPLPEEYTRLRDQRALDARADRQIRRMGKNRRHLQPAATLL